MKHTIQKQLTVLLLLCLSSGAGLYAQAAFGVKAGANFSKFAGSDATDAKMKTGQYGGLMVNIPIGETCSIQPELLYNVLGAKWEDDGEKLTQSLNYISVPLMFQYNNPSGFYVEAGPEAGYLLSASSKYEADGESETDNSKEGLESLHIAACAGIGYNLPMGLGIGVRANIGFTKIAADVNATNQAFSVGIHYTFGSRR